LVGPEKGGYIGPEKGGYIGPEKGGYIGPEKGGHIGPPLHTNDENTDQSNDLDRRIFDETHNENELEPGFFQ